MLAQSHDYILCYSYLGQEIRLDLRDYKEKYMNAYWYEPVSGSYSFIEEIHGKDEIMYTAPKKHSYHNDWVLVIK